MRQLLIMVSIGIAAIIILLTLLAGEPKSKDITSHTINAIISFDDEPFKDRFVFNELELSELNIKVESNARSILDPFFDKNFTRVIASIRSNDHTREYLLAFDNEIIKLENVDGVFRAEYYNDIIPDRLIVRGDKHLELLIKPLVKEHINDDIYYEIKRVKIKDKEIIVEIADTVEKRTLGLMYRDYMPRDGGMLFIMDREENISFWMKNMLISLDIIWIDANGKIIEITKHAKPCLDDISACTYRADGAVKYVLEVNAGFADRYSIEENDTIELDDV